MKKKMWDLYAPIYEKAMRADAHIYEFMYGRIPQVIRGKAVLEIATGSGLLAKHVAPAARRMVATDYSDGMITALDCMTIAAAIPMQMTASIMLQTGVDKGILGRVSAALRMVSIASTAAGEMLFGLLNDATWVWLPIFLGALGVAVAALLFRRVINVNPEPERS